MCLALRVHRMYCIPAVCAIMIEGHVVPVLVPIIMSFTGTGSESYSIVHTTVSWRTWISCLGPNHHVLYRNRERELQHCSHYWLSKDMEFLSWSQPSCPLPEQEARVTALFTLLALECSTFSGRSRSLMTPLFSIINCFLYMFIFHVVASSSSLSS